MGKWQTLSSNRGFHWFWPDKQSSQRACKAWLYISWTEFRSATFSGNGNKPVMAAVSADGGNSFSAPKQLSLAGNNGTGNGRQGSAVRSIMDPNNWTVR